MKKLKVQIIKVTKINDDVFYHVEINDKSELCTMDKKEALDFAEIVEKNYKKLKGLEKKELIYSTDTSNV